MKDAALAKLSTYSTGADPTEGCPLGGIQPAQPSNPEQIQASKPIEVGEEIPRHTVLKDVAVGLFAGFVATQVTNLAQRPLKSVTPEHVNRHEKKVRPGASSSLVAAQKLARRLNVPLSHREEEQWGRAIHAAIGIGWGPVYGLLRRHTGLRPVGAAFATGVAMSMILDEGLVPALGLSAPNHHYMAFTRVRGFIAHLVYGTAVAFADEGCGRLVGRPPRAT